MMVRLLRNRLAVFLFLLSPVAQIQAALFELTYAPLLNGDGVPDPDHVPDYDLDGQHLKDMMFAAAVMWDRIIAQDYPIEIRYHWVDTGCGEEGKPCFSGQLYDAEIDEDTGRVRSATIQFRRDRVFWVDPSPHDDSEFDMEQVLYRDLTSDLQSAWFDSTPPALLEVGFAGAARPATPDNQGFPDATSRQLKIAGAERDLLTLALHELGHALGVGPSDNATADWGGDDKYSVDAVLAGGNGFEAFRNYQGETSGDDHLFPELIGVPPTLMIGAGLGEVWLRRLPSATDTLVMASVDNWASIDLPRKEFWGNQLCWTCGDGVAWTGNRLPDEDDDVFIRHGDSMSLLFVDAHVENVFIDDDSQLRIPTRTLIADNAITMGDGTLHVGNGSGSGQIDALRVDVGYGGLLLMEGGSLNTRSLDIANQGALRGYGTVKLLGVSQLAALRSMGTIAATDGETLALFAEAADNMEIDGHVEAIAGDLEFFALFGVELTGDLEIGAGREVSFNELRAAIGSSIELNGGFNTPATLNPDNLGRLVLSSDLNVNGRGVIAGTAQFNNSSHVVLAPNSSLIVGGDAGLNGVVDVAAFSTIELQGLTSLNAVTIELADGGDFDGAVVFNGPVEYAGGDIVGDGVIYHNNNVLVSADSAVTGDAFDMDGSPDVEDHFFTVASGTEFIVNVQKIESTPLVDGYDGTLTVRGRAEINVASPWRLDGQLVLNPGGISTATLDGSKVVINGRLIVSGSGRISADVQFLPTSIVQVADGAELDLSGMTTYSGGSFQNLGGVIRQTGDAMVTGSTTIFTERFDIDGRFHNAATTIVDGEKFSLFVDHVDNDASGPDTFNGSLFIAGELFVLNEPDQWTMAGNLHFDDGVVSGSKVVVTGTVTGNGVFKSVVTNQGQIAPAPLDPHDPSGVVLFESDLEQLPGGLTRMQIAGLTGDLHDRLTVLGNAVFRGGTLDLVFTDGFAPARGETFDLITIGGSAGGSFEEINVFNLADGFEFSFDLLPVGGMQVYRLTALSDGHFVPEPSSLALLGTVATFILHWSSRRIRTGERNNS